MRRRPRTRSWSCAVCRCPPHGIVAAAGLVLFAGLCAAGCGGKPKPARKPADKARPAGPAPRDSGAAPLSPRVAWRTPYAGRLDPLSVVGEVLIVSSRQRGDRAAGRRVAGFSVKDGRMLWQRPLRLRYFERGVPFSTSHAVAGGVLALALTAGRVEAIDPGTGAKLWQQKSAGGVVAAGEAFALARAEEVLLVGPRDGKILRQQPLASVESGAPGNGLMDALQKGSRLVAVPGGIVLARRHGGALQRLDASTLGGRWLFGPDDALPDRPARLAAGQGTLLVPRLMPKHQVQTQLRALHAEAGELPAGGGATRWTVTVPGRVTAKRLFVTPTQVIALTRASNRQTLLVRVDRGQGKLLDARPFPTPHFCFLGEGLLACQRDKELTALDLDTLAPRWRHQGGAHKTLHSVRRAGKLLVLEEGDLLLVKRLADGHTVYEQPRRLERHPYRVVAALGEAGGRVVLAVRHLEGTPWGDRLLLVGLDLAAGKTAFVSRLGRFPRPDPLRPGAVAEDEKLPGQLPLLWLDGAEGRPAQVLALFEKTLQVVEATSGRALVTRGIPGEEGKPVRLLWGDGRRALLQRGTTLFSLALPDAQLLWQASLFRASFRQGLPDRALIRRAGPKGGALELVPPKAPDPLAAGRALVEREGCTLRHGSASLWLCQGETHLLVVDPQAGKILERLPRAASLSWEGGLLLATHPSKEKSATPGAWLGVDLVTGKERWRLKETADPGARPRAPLPPPFEEERAWRPVRWAEALGGLFLVTDEAGACVQGVREETGRPALRACFGGLGGPPVAYEGKLLLTAAPASGQKGGLSLFLLDPATGAARPVQAPEAGKGFVLGTAGVRGNRLFLTVHPLRGSFTHNEVLGLDLR